ncbi:MAG: ATP-binding cassette domain-containing protein [Fluviicola sp.]|nr:ATP-binding cassette domain-containing protein [Fluviicola sp.]
MQKHIEIKGARVHNLKNIDVSIQHGKLTVITGLSGSGKSSLAFDTLYAEGQRRYIESLSSYARQFLGKLDKPDTDYIKGISPAIAIEQKVTSNNPRSTVGTTTEIYNYLKILFAKVGKTYSPISGNEVKKHTVFDVISFLKTLENGSKVMLLAPIHGFEKYGIERQLAILKDQGFVRLFIKNEVVEIEELLAAIPSKIENAYLLVDRIKTDFDNEENEGRYSDSISLAFLEGQGKCSIFQPDHSIQTNFSNLFELDGIEFQEPSEHFFTFNNPFGACKTCEGFGSVIGIDDNLVIPNKSLSVFEGAILPWKGETMSEYLNELVFNAKKFDFPIHRPIQDLTEKEYQLLWEGNKYFSGLNAFFKFLESQTYKIQYRVMLSRYRGKTGCPDCKGTRLRKDANNVKIEGKTITDFVLTPVSDILTFFKEIDLNNYDPQIAKRIFPEITSRLSFLEEVGLGYRLINVLKNLRDLGNTVIVVEHEEEMMKAADEIIDIGPMAGVYGGEVVFQGDFSQLINSERSLTAKYLTHQEIIPLPKKRRTSKDVITISGARLNNLKNINVDFPLNKLVCITGVSGSGKSTLVKEILYPSIRKELGLIGDTNINIDLSGDFKQIKNIEFIDQNPIGKSSRSNPITYVKAFDDIRELFSRQQVAKLRGYKPGFFSFNVEGGRCEICEGEGEITVGMQFMADVHLKCENCDGKRYKQETLEIEYRGKNIADILAMDIEEALNFFKEGKDKLEQKIAEKIHPLFNVGLGYVQLGQSSSTLSGGEAQRIKLASFLINGSNTKHTLFIFDEPTTGLHFHDINKLLIALNELVNVGHSVIVIEHNTDVIKCADWIIDIGPEGGDKGGNVNFAGTPEDLIKIEGNYTGKFLKEKL